MARTNTDRLKSPLVWILSLAFLSVGARNFEMGISIDAPLYATIARNIARTGEWFLLDPGVPDFRPYCEHPHLGFWILALLFKALPSQDWVARIPGHLFYVGFLFLLYTRVKKLSGEKTAVATILLLWIWSRFSNTFSNVYLDPSALFFGTVSVFAWDHSLSERKIKWALVAGFSFGLCAMSKGLTCLGFVPVLAVLSARSLWQVENRRLVARNLFCALVALSLVLGVYVSAVGRSAVPDFLTLYWSRQMTQRFAVTWSWHRLVEARFWTVLLKDTYCLAPLALLRLRRPEFSSAFLIPVVLILTFVLMYAPADRIGVQYWAMILPWLAWCVADGCFSRLPWNPAVFQKRSAELAIVGVLVLQYFPIRTHKFEPPESIDGLKRLASTTGIREVFLDATPGTYLGFITGAPFAWYADLRVNYIENRADVPRPSARQAYVLLSPDTERESGLHRSGWCVSHRYVGTSIWTSCSIVSR